jgi:pentapeptide MXKDX repeat protein
MGKVWQVIAVSVVGLALSFAIVGCGSSTAPTKDKMGGDKTMGGERMKDNKMAGDKMGADKMKDDKMGGDKMKDDKMKDGGK